MSFDNDVLIKLRRTYTKDENISFLNRKISDFQIEIGKLKSEIDEYKDINIENRLEIERLECLVKKYKKTEQNSNLFKSQESIRNRVRCLEKKVVTQYNDKLVAEHIKNHLKKIVTENMSQLEINLLHTELTKAESKFRQEGIKKLNPIKP